MRLFKQLLGVFAVLAVLVGLLMIFAFDVVKIQWVTFMGIQPSYKQMENPLPPPGRSIPIEGPITIPGLGAPENPTPADDASVTRGAELFAINCAQCHGATGEGNGTVAAFLMKYKPANLTGPLLVAMSDGAIFMTISQGVPDRMPALNENLTVQERWDVVNYVRTLQPAK